MEYGKFTELQMDVLREIGNIGSGNAATALSSMLQQPINISIPQVNMIKYNDLVEKLGGPETLIVGILLDVTGELEGTIMFLMKKEFTAQIISTLLFKEEVEFEALTEMDLSVIQEIGNILSASYVNSIAGLTGLRLDLSVPSLCVDMAGSIVSFPAIKYGEIGDNVLMFEGSFDDNSILETKIMLILENNSLDVLMTRLGVQ